MKYPSDSKEKKHEYYQRYVARKLAEDPEYFKHKYHETRGRLGQEHYNAYSARWRKTPEGIEYHKKYRDSHKEYHSQKSREWRKQNNVHHSEANQEWVNAHPEIKKAQYLANDILKIPLAKFCEVCPEDDVRLAVHRHHPDYDYPQITVSCCKSCHYYLNKDRDTGKKLTGEKHE
jgi:hypothetical protein